MDYSYHTFQNPHASQKDQTNKEDFNFFFSGYLSAIIQAQKKEIRKVNDTVNKYFTAQNAFRIR